MLALNDEELETLISWKNNSGNNLLHILSSSCYNWNFKGEHDIVHDAIAKLIGIEKWLDKIAEKNSDGQTPLVIAASNGYVNLIEQILAAKPHSIEELQLARAFAEEEPKIVRDLFEQAILNHNHDTLVIEHSNQIASEAEDQSTYLAGCTIL